MADRGEPEASCSAWHGNGMAGERTAPLNTMTEVLDDLPSDDPAGEARRLEPVPA